MGYPMTWQRIVNRNGLADGDYGKAPDRWALNCNMTKDPSLAAGMADHWRQELERKDRQIMTFAGDLRRLENDVRDEGIVCQRIAHRIQIEPDVVAAVLKEFFAT